MIDRVGNQQPARIDDMGVGTARLGHDFAMRSVLDHPDIVHPGLARLFLDQHRIKQLHGLGRSQLPARIGAQNDLEAGFGLGVVHQRRCLREGKAGGRGLRDRGEEIAIRRRAAGDLEIDPPLDQPVPLDQFGQHSRPIGVIADPRGRLGAFQPGGMVRPVAEMAIQHRRYFIDPLPEQQAAIEDRNMGRVFGEPLAIEPYHAHKPSSRPLRSLSTRHASS